MVDEALGRTGVWVTGPGAFIKARQTASPTAMTASFEQQHQQHNTITDNKYNTLFLDQ